MIYDYISTFDSFRLILESIFLPLYYKAFYKHKGETLLTCCSTHWEGRGGISPLTYVKLHIISVKLQLTGKSSLTYQLYFSIHFRFREWYDMFKVENIHTQVHSVVLTIMLCTLHTLPQIMKLLQRKSCPFLTTSCLHCNVCIPWCPPWHAVFPTSQSNHVNFCTDIQSKAS